MNADECTITQKPDGYFYSRVKGKPGAYTGGFSTPERAMRALENVIRLRT